MKKFLLSLCLVAFAVTCTLAQSTAPRFATTALGDNTGRVLTYGIKTASTGTMVTLFPAYYTTLVSIPTTSASPTWTANITKSFYGDRMQIFVAANATGTRTITLSTNIIGTAATHTLAASKKGYSELVFDGIKWMEVDWTVEP